jgi:hypothetical protein
MTQDLLRAGREAREGDGRHIKAAEGAELLFRADGGVTEAGGHRRCRCEAVVIVGHRDAKLGSRQQSVADERLRQVHHGAVSEIGCEQAVLHLEAALRDDHAGIGDRGTIGGDGRQEFLSKIQHLHARALAAAEAAPSPERAAALRLFAANLHKAFYAFEPDFFQHNLVNRRRRGERHQRLAPVVADARGDLLLPEGSQRIAQDAREQSEQVIGSRRRSAARN